VVKLDAGTFKVEPSAAPVNFRYEGEELTVRFFVTIPPGTKRIGVHAQGLGGRER
jgi:hypothetical protein